MTIDYNSLAKRNATYSSLEEKWETVDDLWKGTDGMREAGQKHLPKGKNEKSEIYSERLNEATLVNFYKRAVTKSVDFIVAEDIIVNNVQGQFRDFYDDVDAEGRDITEFTEDILRMAIHYGVAYQLTDSSIDGGRPYILEINPRNVLGFDTRRINDQETLTSFRYYETLSAETNDDTNTVQSGEVADRIRLYNLVIPGDEESYSILPDELQPEFMSGEPYVEYAIIKREKQTTGLTTGSDMTEWVFDRGGILEGLEEIPVDAVYGNRTSFFIGTPVYMDTAELNIKHWRSGSLQDYALKFGRYPFQIVSGVGQTKPTSPNNPNDDPAASVTTKIEIPAGPGNFFGIANENVSVHEFTAGISALEPGFKDLELIEQQIMQTAPVLALNNQSGDLTATATAVNTAGAVKLVKRIARRYKKTLMGSAARLAAYFNTNTLPMFEMNLEMFDRGIVNDRPNTVPTDE